MGTSIRFKLKEKEKRVRRVVLCNGNSRGIALATESFEINNTTIKCKSLLTHRECTMDALWKTIELLQIEKYLLAMLFVDVVCSLFTCSSTSNIFSAHILNCVATISGCPDGVRDKRLNIDASEHTGKQRAP